MTETTSRKYNKKAHLKTELTADSDFATVANEVTARFLFGGKLTINVRQNGKPAVTVANFKRLTNGDMSAVGSAIRELYPADEGAKTKAVRVEANDLAEMVASVAEYAVANAPVREGKVNSRTGKVSAVKPAVYVANEFETETHMNDVLASVADGPVADAVVDVPADADPVEESVADEVTDEVVESGPDGDSAPVSNVDF